MCCTAAQPPEEYIIPPARVAVMNVWDLLPAAQSPARERERERGKRERERERERGGKERERGKREREGERERGEREREGGGKRERERERGEREREGEREGKEREGERDIFRFFKNNLFTYVYNFFKISVKNHMLC